VAFQRAFGIDVLDCSGRQLIEAARHFSVPLPADLREDSIDEILNVMFATAIEQQLGGSSDGGRICPEFLGDYPPSQAALAVVSETKPPVARRFELYVQGLELCNGYQELTDARELRRREAVQRQRRISEQSPELPGASRLMAAMQSGLPPCSGVAMGFDRLAMMATGSTDICEVMAFAEDRA
jgi:lysyl-tRNA synthetase class 2